MSSIEWANETWSASNTIGILEKDVTCAMAGLHRDVDAFDQALLEALKSLPAVEQ